MKFKKQRKQSLWLKRAARFCAVLFVFYVIADVTVLEAFCGNPSLGIASYHQVVETGSKNSAQAVRTVFVQSTTDNSRSSQEKDDQNFPLDGDDCLCFCSYPVPAYHSLVSPLPAFEEQLHTFILRERQSDSHPSPHFRPPRRA